MEAIYIFIMLGVMFALIVMLLQCYYIFQLKRIEKRFMTNMIKAIEKLEWRE